MPYKFNKSKNLHPSNFHWALWWILIMIGYTKTWGLKMLWSSWWTWNWLEKGLLGVVSGYCIYKLFWLLLNICTYLWNYKYLNINISQVSHLPFMWYLYGLGNLKIYELFSNTTMIVTPRPGKVHTWQPSRAFE